MRILDTYLRDGAPRFVPLSAECRGGILRSMASSVYTFGRAREEILDRLRRTAAEQGERGPMVSDLLVIWLTAGLRLLRNRCTYRVV